MKGGEKEMVKINNYDFEGPYSLSSSFNEVAGIYVIYTTQSWLDVGETDKLGSRISNHERKKEWYRYAEGLPIWLAFLEVSDSGRRLQIESELRSLLQPICGER